ncbi:Gdt1 family [Arabidopsis thaliana x Arabidopsis arenosa]|uniref:GDT1 family protein n=1 Tax=Arabidopsis thaliana x Arabidopsis arenosa TaxID=1240361 RepID=A0A8T1XI97_9BRAS|nr:Gdt1 family [Arabidopsis thaliana x Arabidopsis arenosa]
MPREDSLPSLILKILYPNISRAEWGDRSKIATIDLATHKNAIGLSIGATIGQTRCVLHQRLLEEACWL